MVRNEFPSYSSFSIAKSREFLGSGPQGPFLYNHDIMTCTADNVTGNGLYSARALCMTEEQDIIQLSEALRDEWPFISAHYDRIGLSYTQQVVWSTRLEQCALHPDYQPSFFFFGESEHRSHNDQSWFDVVRYINSKNHFVTLASQLGVPVPKTRCFDAVADLSPEIADTFTYPCYLKASVSVSGAGIYRCESASFLLAALPNFDPSTPVQVQEEVLTDCFLNLQYEVVNGHHHRLLATEQILEGPVHQGNLHPPRTAPWEIVDPIAEWMAERGYKGVFAFDIAVIEDPCETQYLAIECNPRYNGASYPTAIAMKLNIPIWEARYFKTWHNTLSDINLEGLEYDPVSGEGVIIVNWGPVLMGKLMFMLAGPDFVRRKLHRELRQRLW